jgi:hypothetical protein
MSGSNGTCSVTYLCTAVGGYDGPTGLGTPNQLTAFTAGASAPSADYSLTATPSQTVAQGGSASYTVTVTPTNGFTGTVTFGTTGLPNGATASFNPASVSGPGTQTATMTVTTTSSLAAGSYGFSVTGTGPPNHSAATTLVVTQAAQTGDFAVSVSPQSATIGRTSTTQFTVTISRQSFSGAVSLSATDSSSGLSESFSPNSTTSTSSTLTVRARNLGRGQHFTVTITGASGSLRHSTTLSLST